MIRNFSWPSAQRRAEDLKLLVNGVEVTVLRCNEADIALFECDPGAGALEVVLELPPQREDYAGALKPLRHGIELSCDGMAARFQMPATLKASLELKGRNPVFLWPCAPDANKPDPADPMVRFFAEGQTYEVGKFDIGAGETVYIEGGAVVRGRLFANQADGVTIRGSGVLDGSCYSKAKGETHASIFIGHSKDTVVRDITMINPPGWMLVPGNCDNVEITNVRQHGEVVSSDGIDIVGSRKVTVRDCFLRNNDDCVVIKSTKMNKPGQDAAISKCNGNVEDILVEDCTFWNAPAGNGSEIGHELDCDHIRNVTFRNIDILACHGMGAPFSIHAFDRASVENITWEDIRVEHCWDMFIDFRVSASHFSNDNIRGRIKGVTLRNVEWHKMSMNSGYTTSMICGYGPGNLAEDITIENLTINGKKVVDFDELEIPTRYVKNIVVK